MPILLDPNPLHVGPGCRRVPMTQRILRLDDASRGFTHPPGKGVSCLVQMDIPDAGPPSVYLDPFGKGVPGQLITGVQLGPIV